MIFPKTETDRPYEGMEAILHARSSTTKQTVSVKDQLAAMRAFCKRHRIIIVAEVTNVGKSGSKTWARDDIAEILALKQKHPAVTLVIAYDSSRFTRGGTLDGFGHERDFNRAGLVLLFSNEEKRTGLYGDIQTSFNYASAQIFAHGISKTASRGRQSSIDDRRSLPGTITPYGCDKLICASDWTPKHIVRTLTSGLQQVLDPSTSTVLEEFGHEVDGQRRTRYIKQQSDKVELLPGDPERVRVVRQIFDWRFRHGIGAKSIARRLNDAAVPSPTGSIWHPNVIKKMLRNPVYIGYALGNRTSIALYHRGVPMVLSKCQKTPR